MYFLLGNNNICYQKELPHSAVNCIVGLIRLLKKYNNQIKLDLMTQIYHVINKLRLEYFMFFLASTNANSNTITL